MSASGGLTAPPQVEVDLATTPARPHSHKVCRMRSNEDNREQQIHGPVTTAAAEQRAARLVTTRIRRYPCHILSSARTAAKV